MQRIAVVGGGLIGQGWAMVFAQAGFTVAIYDPSEDVRKTVCNTIKQRIAEMVSAELVTAILGEKMLEQLTVAHSLEEAVDGVCLLYTSPSPRDRTRSRMPSSA